MASAKSPTTTASAAAASAVLLGFPDGPAELADGSEDSSGSAGFTESRIGGRPVSERVSKGKLNSAQLFSPKL